MKKILTVLNNAIEMINQISNGYCEITYDISDESYASLTIIVNDRRNFYSYTVNIEDDRTEMLKDIIFENLIALNREKYELSASKCLEFDILCCVDLKNDKALILLNELLNEVTNKIDYDSSQIN